MQSAVCAPLLVRPVARRFSTPSYPACQESLARGVAYLLATQEPDGHWWDFWLPVGASDAWVTAYTALALLDAAAGPHLPAP
ncbi:MAG: hypothetical protein WAZ19_16615, partial [Anaerolineae bacterium]